MFGFLYGLKRMKRRKKRQVARATVANALNLDLSYIAAMRLMRGAPYWTSGDEEDKARWFSLLMSDFWPYIEPQISAIVRDGGASGRFLYYA